MSKYICVAAVDSSVLVLLVSENGRCSLGYLDPIADLTTSSDDKEWPARNETETCNEQSKAADTNSKRCIWPDVYLSIIGGGGGGGGVTRKLSRSGVAAKAGWRKREREKRGKRGEGKRQISRHFTLQIIYALSEDTLRCSLHSSTPAPHSSSDGR